MSFLAITIPVSLILGAVFLVLVIREVRSGGFDDMEGPAHRMLFDDDHIPERESDGVRGGGPAPSRPGEADGPR